MPPAGRVTKWLCGSILIITLVLAVTQRRLGFGTDDLAFNVPHILQGHIWRLVTYPWAIRHPMGLIIGIVVLWLFGRSLEARWGSRDFLRFFMLSTAGAGLWALPLYFVINIIMPFQDMGLIAGPGPAIDAMLVAMALTMPDSNVFFGFVMPVRARTIVYLLLGYEVITGMMTGAANLSITLGGMLMGYILITGIWRPTRLLARINMVRHRRRRRSHLHVVPPPGRSGGNGTLH